jgi:Lectin C-type domain
LALYDINDEGNFKWCMGNYSLPLKKDALVKFASGQPDNFKGSENCANLNFLKMELNDIPCDHKSPFICEVN